MEMPSWRTHLKMKTTPGQWYTVEVKALVNEKVVGFGRTQFKAGSMCYDALPTIEK